jgi:hypothetical protein
MVDEATSTGREDVTQAMLSFLSNDATELLPAPPSSFVDGNTGFNAVTEQVLNTASPPEEEDEDEDDDDEVKGNVEDNSEEDDDEDEEDDEGEIDDAHRPVPLEADEEDMDDKGVGNLSFISTGILAFGGINNRILA